MTVSSKDFRRTPRHKMDHPKGWEPGVVWNPTTGGTLTTGPVDGDLDPAVWDHLIEDFGIDPNVTEVIPGSVQVRAWDANMGDGEVKRFKYYRATIKPRTSFGTQADIESLIQHVSKKKAAKASLGASGHSFVTLLSDWQVGNGEAGGSEKITQQILDSLDRTVEYAKLLRKMGRGSETAYLLGLGDLSEACTGFYAMQEYSVDLNQREQDRLVRHLILAWIDAFIDAQFNVVAVGIPGNHGENRKDGKAFTSFADNRDVQCFEIIAEIMSQNPARYGGVSVPMGAIDKYDMTATLDVSGVPISIAHGHQFPSAGASKSAGAEKWLADQALGRQAVADCEILFSGHYHHFTMSEATGRTVVVAPASDTGSAWYTMRTGKNSPSGVLSLNVGSDLNSRGWGDLNIL